MLTIVCLVIELAGSSDHICWWYRYVLSVLLTDTAPTVIYIFLFLGSVRCLEETVLAQTISRVRQPHPRYTSANPNPSLLTLTLVC